MTDPDTFITTHVDVPRVLAYVGAYLMGYNRVWDKVIHRMTAGRR